MSKNIKNYACILALQNSIFWICHCLCLAANVNWFTLIPVHLHHFSYICVFRYEYKHYLRVVFEWLSFILIGLVDHGGEPRFVASINFNSTLNETVNWMSFAWNWEKKSQSKLSRKLFISSSISLFLFPTQ